MEMDSLEAKRVPRLARAVWSPASGTAMRLAQSAFVAELRVRAEVEALLLRLQQQWLWLPADLRPGVAQSERRVFRCLRRTATW